MVIRFGFSLMKKRLQNCTTEMGLVVECRLSYVKVTFKDTCVALRQNYQSYECNYPKLLHLLTMIDNKMLVCVG